MPPYSNKGSQGEATSILTPGDLKALAKHLDWLETLDVPPSALADITPVKIEQWADEAQRMIATELKEYRAPRRGERAKPGATMPSCWLPR
jgi:hypothetical protein